MKTRTVPAIGAIGNSSQFVDCSSPVETVVSAYSTRVLRNALSDPISLAKACRLDLGVCGALRPSGQTLNRSKGTWHFGQLRTKT